MPEGFFQPLPIDNQSQFDYDKLLRWLGSQTIVAEKIIGTLVAVALYSDNWDGDIPADLSSEDTGATAGYYLDSDEGAAQFMGNIFLNGTLNIGGGAVNLLMEGQGAVSSLRTSDFVSGTSGWRIRGADAEFNGNVTINEGVLVASKFRTSSSGERLVINDSQGDRFIRIFNSDGDAVGFIGYDATGYGADEMVFTTERNLNPILLDADGGIQLEAGGSAGLGVNVSNAAPAGAIPATPFLVASGTGGGFVVKNSDADATPTWAFANTENTGINRVSSSALGIVGGGKRLLTVVGSAEEVRIWEDLHDIGNHETLRADRTASGTGVTTIGYNSSNRSAKREIVPLDRSKLWKSEWFDRLAPVKFRRRSTQGREFSFILEDVAEISPHLTTKGDSIGGALDELALLAVTVQALKETRAYARDLEARLSRVEGLPAVKAGLGSP